MNKKILKLKISGMSCASCASRIEKELNKISGVDASVDIVTHSSKVSIDEKSISKDKIISTIKSLGYDVFDDAGDNSDSNTSRINSVLKIRLIVAIVAGVFFAALMILHMFSYHLDSLILVSVQLVIATIVVFFSGYSFLKSFVCGLKHFSLTMDTLVSLGSLASYFLSIYNMTIGKIDALYFESVVFLIMFVLLGKFLEGKSIAKTSDEIKKLLELSPDEATLIVKTLDGEREITIKTKDISVGQMLRVKPGGKVPVDGIIEDGEALLNESMLTGESTLSEKSVGGKVFAGTINTAHSFVLRAEKIGEDTLLGNVIKLVNEAKHSKLPVQKLVDKVSLYFVPSIIIIAVVVLIFWILLGYSYSFAIINAISVLVIACPCALGLATPVAIMVGFGKASSLGIFIRKSESLQKISKVTDVAFDKTGTLTTGKFKVSNVFSSEENESELLSILASIEKFSEHPIGVAIVEYAKENDIKFYDVDKFKSYSGFGVTAEINEIEYVVGTLNFMASRGIEFEPCKFKNLGSGTSVFLGSGNHILGFVELSDQIKSEASVIISRLKSLGIVSYLLSGDNEGSVKKVSSQLDINDYRYSLLPNDKCEFVKNLQKKGRVVAMVGDGINDAPVLSAADVGISMANGSDIAIETGDIVLARGDLNLILSMIKLSKITMIKIKQNLFWAVIYNIVCIPVAALGFLNPAIAGLAMAISSICVVVNSLSIRK